MPTCREVFMPASSCLMFVIRLIFLSTNSTTIRILSEWYRFSGDLSRIFEIIPFASQKPPRRRQARKSSCNHDRSPYPFRVWPPATNTTIVIFLARYHKCNSASRMPLELGCTYLHLPAIACTFQAYLFAAIPGGTWGNRNLSCVFSESFPYSFATFCYFLAKNLLQEGKCRENHWQTPFWQISYIC